MLLKRYFMAAFILCACTPRQESVQIIYQITDQRQITQIVGDNNTTVAKSESVAEQVAEPEQTSDQTTNSMAWLVWVLLGLGVIVAAAVLAYLALKKWGIL